MTTHGRVIDDPQGERIAALEQRIVDLEAALARVAAYLGVTHVAKKPEV
jgi:hypothetical protein